MPEWQEKGRPYRRAAVSCSKLATVAAFRLFPGRSSDWRRRPFSRDLTAASEGSGALCNNMKFKEKARVASANRRALVLYLSFFHVTLLTYGLISWKGNGLFQKTHSVPLESR